MKITNISRTIGKDQIVDELVISFTHDTEIDYLLPGIAPTGKYVEIPHVVVMKFRNNKNHCRRKQEMQIILVDMLLTAFQCH